MNTASVFRRLHHGEGPLLLPNVWNAHAARLVEGAGYKAVATSSAAVAMSMGYEDGEEIPFDELLYVVRRIRASVSLPLSVDIESGFASDIAGLLRRIDALVDLGVAGINLEDGRAEQELHPVEVLSNKIRAIRKHLDARGADLFINARTDAFLIGLPEAGAITEERIPQYAAAGADGIFVPFVPTLEALRPLVAATTLPVNALGRPDAYTVEELQGAGVRRVSMGAFGFRAAYGYFDEVLRRGNEVSFSPRVGA